MKVHRLALAPIAAAGGALAALSSAAIAQADLWEISPSQLDPPIIDAVSGQPPWDQSVLEEGGFDLGRITPNTTELYQDVTGQLSSTSSFGMTNADFVTTRLYTLNFETVIPQHSVFDITTMGSFQNIYADLPGFGPNGTNQITDTLVTPFGNVNIPTTFDAAAFGSTSLPAAAEPAATAGALSAATEYSILPDPGDGESTVTSVGGLAPLYTTIDYSGTFDVQNSTYDGVVIGNAEYYSDLFGLHNVLLQVQADAVSIPHGVIDDLSFGNGWENVYTDFIDSTGVAPNTITDTLITPFGDFNIPVAYDAVADFPTPLPGAATDFLGSLTADWSTLVADLNAMF